MKIMVQNYFFKDYSIPLPQNALTFLSHLPEQCRTQGGPEGHVPPPPEEAKSALKNDKKKLFFHVLLKEKVRKGGGTDKAVTLATGTSPVLHYTILVPPSPLQ